MASGSPCPGTAFSAGDAGREEAVKRQRPRHRQLGFPVGGSRIYLVAPHAGFFGNKIVKGVLHFGICRNEQQQVPHAESDPGECRRNRKRAGEAHSQVAPPGCDIPPLD